MISVDTLVNRYLCTKPDSNQHWQLILYQAYQREQQIKRRLEETKRLISKRIADKFAEKSLTSRHQHHHEEDEAA